MLLIHWEFTLSAIVLRCRDWIQFTSEHLFEGYKRNPKPSRMWFSNKIKLSLLLWCSYGWNMIECYLFLGHPSDTVKNFTSWISQSKYLGVPGQQLLHTQLMQVRMVCFYSLSASMNWPWEQTIQTWCFSDFMLEFCYLRQAGRNPSISYHTKEKKQRQKAVTEPTDCTYRHARRSRITSLSL